jgi:peptide subunit release factor RF-3
MINKTYLYVIKNIQLYTPIVFKSAALSFYAIRRRMKQAFREGDCIDIEGFGLLYIGDAMSTANLKNEIKFEPYFDLE